MHRGWVMHASAPKTEIGYTQAPNYNWWLFEDETTPELRWPQSITVFDAMRRTDSQCASVLRAVTLPVRRTPWRIDPAGARLEVAQFVADDLGLPVVGQTPKPPLRSKDKFSWPEHLRLALLMLPLGHAYFEQVYRVDADGSAAHLRKLAYRPAKTIERIDVAPDGGLVSITQWWTQADTKPKPIPVDRLVAYIHEREGGNWLGSSVLRSAYKNWLLKDRLLRVQAQTIERNGMGIPLYKGQEGASGDDLAAGKAMATAWRAGEAAGSAVPFGADLVLRGVEGTLPDADPVVRYHDEQIARAVLAHFLNLGTQTGSWALGTTFADFFTLSLQTLAQQIADTATQHIIEDLVDINFGEQEPAPRLVFDEIGSRQAATAQSLKSLVDAGLIKPDEVLDETVRQQYGLPPADPATATAPPAAPPALPQPVLDGVPLAAGTVDHAPVAARKFIRDNNGEFAEVPGAGAVAKALLSGRDNALDGFNREQLRREAKNRGIDLPKGAHPDVIRDALWDHQHAGVGPVDGGGPKTPAAGAADGQTRLAAAVASGVKSAEPLSGGNQAVVERVTFNDGSQGVRKKAIGTLLMPFPEIVLNISAAEQQDAEELASKVANLFGLHAPAVHRTSPEEAVFELVDGETGMYHIFETPGFDQRQHARSDEGVLMGFLDAVISNPDRHEGNWMIDSQGRLAPIDHGVAFQKLHGPDLEANTNHNLFIEQFTLAGYFTEENPMSPQDIATAKARLQELEPEFVRLGREQWFSDTMGRLEEVGKYATGTKVRLP